MLGTVPNRSHVEYLTRVLLSYLFAVMAVGVLGQLQANPRCVSEATWKELNNLFFENDKDVQSSIENEGIPATVHKSIWRSVCMK